MGIMETALFVGEKDQVKVKLRLLLPDSAKKPSVIVEISVGEHPESGNTVCFYLRDLNMGYGIADVLRRALNEGKDEYEYLLKVCRERGYM